MRNVASLITDVRTISRNVANQDGTYSITDSEILIYLNDAQVKCQNKLSSSKNIAKIFVTEQILSVVGAQADYTLTDRVLLNKQIENVEFSATGATSDYVRLEKVHFIQRDTYQTTYPSGYYKRGNQIVLQPTPSTSQGSIRVMYERQLDDLAASIDVVNGTPSGTSIVLTTGYTLNAGNYINVVDALGNVMLRNALVSSYNAGTKTITLAANVSTYLVGSYALSNLASGIVVLGIYSTNISQLPDSCERYLIHSAAADVFGKDSSNDFARQRDKADEILKEIVETFKAQTSEVQFIPQINRYEWF